MMPWKYSLVLSHKVSLLLYLERLIHVFIKRKIMMLCLLITTFSSITIANAASTPSAPVKSPLLLKINQFYVAYTAPHAPYVDNKNRLMVPLRSISDLLAADVNYDAKTKIAMITRKNYLKEEEKNFTIKMIVGSKEIEINNVKSEMDTVPTLVKESMFIPLSVVTKALHIETTWDHNKGLVSLNLDPAYLPSGVVSDEGHLGKSDTKVRPINSTIQTTVNKAGIPIINVNVTALNEGKSSLSKGNYLRFYVQDSNFGSFDVYNKDQIKPGNTFSVQTTNTILADSLRYILVDAFAD
jgi:hypothetical protein